MARAPKLKVYRTPIGFHDAYVAAPSQKAALKAWGSDADLFARGIAEQVDDPELIREPLAKPGIVVKRSRGTAAEQLAALPPDPPRQAPRGKASKDEHTQPPAKRRATPRPRPSRAELDRAEQAIDDATRDHEAKRSALGEREQQLARERRELEAAHEAQAARLEKQRKAAQLAYDRAMQAYGERRGLA